MKQYTKEIDGKTVIKTRKDIIIHKDGMNTYNPSEEMLLADGWVEYVQPEPTEEELLQRAKIRKKQEIEAYDKSDEVNLFYIGDTPMWLDKETRTGLMLRFQAEISLGNENTTLWANGVQYPLPLATAVQMLYALEVYASACYDNTQRHLSETETLATIEAIEAYDYTWGYPEKLRF